MYNSERLNENINEDINPKEDYVPITEDVDCDEDILLSQIDAFKEKAQHIQALINTKAKKVKELENLVREKEIKNIELQNILSKKQKEAKGTMDGINERVDELMHSIDLYMNELKDDLSKSILTDDKASIKQTKAIQYTLSSINEELTGLKSDIEDKVHKDNVKLYRNLKDLFNDSFKDKDIVEKINYNNRVNISIKKGISFLIILSLLNLTGILVFILHNFGLI